MSFDEEYRDGHDECRHEIESLCAHLLATQAHVARLEYALSQWQEGSLNEPHLSLCYRLTDEALSTPVNLDALHEDRARECERLAAGLLNDNAIDWLTREAAAHRSKKNGA